MEIPSWAAAAKPVLKDQQERQLVPTATIMAAEAAEPQIIRLQQE